MDTCEVCGDVVLEGVDCCPECQAKYNAFTAEVEYDEWVAQSDEEFEQAEFEWQMRYC